MQRKQEEEYFSMELQKTIQLKVFLETTKHVMVQEYFSGMKQTKICLKVIL